MDVVTNTDELQSVKEKPRNKKRFKQLMITLLTVFVLTFSAAGINNVKSVDAWWGGDIVKWVEQKIGSIGADLGGNQTVGQAMYNAKKGGSWRYGEGMAQEETSGVYGSKSSPLNKKNFKNDSSNNRVEFVAWGDWSTQQRLRISYVGSFNSIPEIIRLSGRFIGGGLLMFAYLVSSIVAWVGLLVFKMIDVLNFFKYIKPNYTLDGGFQLQGSLAWAQPMVDLFGGFRQLGVVAAILTFIISLSLVFLTMRVGRNSNGGRKAKSAFGRFFLSIFSLTMMTVMLSSMISGFAVWMNDTDDLGQDQTIGSLIFAYKDWVYAPYSTKYADGESKDKIGKAKNQLFLVPDTVPNAPTGTGTQLLGTRTGGYALPKTLGGDFASRTAGAVSPAMVYSMNHQSGAVKSSTNTKYAETGITAAMAGETASKHLDDFFNGQSMDLITGWMRGSTTGSASTGSTFGPDSGATAQYLTQFDAQDQVMHRQVNDTSAAAVRAYDYNIPGGMTSFFRWMKAVVIMICGALFALVVYFFIANSIFDMWHMIIPRLPAAMAFGSFSAIVLIFEAVIIMMIQVVVGRVLITTYNNVVGGTIGSMFEGLFNLLPGTIMVDAAGAVGDIGLTDGLIMLDSIASSILAVMLFKLFLKLYKQLGAEFGRLAADFAIKLTGTGDRDAQSRIKSDLGGIGSGRALKQVGSGVKNKLDKAGDKIELAATAGMALATGGTSLAAGGAKSALSSMAKAKGKSALANAGAKAIGINSDEKDKKSIDTNSKSALGLNSSNSQLDSKASVLDSLRKMSNSDKINNSVADQSLKSLAKENGQSAIEFANNNPSAKSALEDNAKIKDENGISNGAKISTLRHASKMSAKYNDAKSQAQAAKANLAALTKQANSRSAMTPEQQVEIDSKIANAQTSLDKANSSAKTAKANMIKANAQASAMGIKLKENDGGASANAALTAATHALAGQSIAAKNQNGMDTSEVTVSSNGSINTKAINTIANNPSKQKIAKLSASDVKVNSGSSIRTVHNKVNVKNNDKVRSSSSTSELNVGGKGLDSSSSTTSTVTVDNDVNEVIDNKQGSVTHTGGKSFSAPKDEHLSTASTRNVTNTRNVKVRDNVKTINKNTKLDADKFSSNESKKTTSTATVDNHVRENITSKDVLGGTSKGPIGATKPKGLKDLNSSRNITEERKVNVKDNIISKKSVSSKSNTIPKKPIRPKKPKKLL